MNEIHPSLVNAPKSLRESLERVHEFLLKNPEMGNCMYRDSKGNNCIIGQFFTTEQLDGIRDSELKYGTGAVGPNSTNIRVLTVHYIGTKNLYAMTHMNIAQCEELQGAFDNKKRDLVQKVKDILDGRSNELTAGGVLFNL